jgi:hypothetical protein
MIDVDLMKRVVWVFFLSFVLGLVFACFVNCGQKTILESTHKKNIAGEWVPDDEE